MHKFPRLDTSANSSNVAEHGRKLKHLGTELAISVGDVDVHSPERRLPCVNAQVRAIQWPISHQCYEAKRAAAGQWCWDKGSRVASACRHSQIGGSAGSSEAATCQRLTKVISAATNNTVTVRSPGPDMYDPSGVEQRSFGENLIISRPAETYHALRLCSPGPDMIRRGLSVNLPKKI